MYLHRAFPLDSRFARARKRRLPAAGIMQPLGCPVPLLSGLCREVSCFQWFAAEVSARYFQTKYLAVEISEQRTYVGIFRTQSAVSQPHRPIYLIFRPERLDVGEDFDRWNHCGPSEGYRLQSAAKFLRCVFQRFAGRVRVEGLDSVEVKRDDRPQPAASRWGQSPCS